MTDDIEILHLTDLHLQTDRQARLKGVPTWAAFEEIFEFLEQAGFLGRAEWLVLTGDIAHDELPTTYHLFREQLGERWASRCLLIPGNHDQRAALRETFPEHALGGVPWTGFSQAVGNWRLVGLDSHVPGEVHGELGEPQRAWLREELAGGSERESERWVVLFVHHPPFPIGCPWLDGIRLSDDRQLASLIAEFPHVRAVVSGHVHQERSTTFAGRQAWTTPSTAVQFGPDGDQLELDESPPGFRRLVLHADGRLTSEVVRLPELRHRPTT